MECIYCGGKTHRNGKRNGVQRYVCTECSKWFSRSGYSKTVKIRKDHPDKDGERYCPDCDQYLPMDDFHNSIAGYKATYCKSCSSYRQKMRTHGVSKKEFNDMYDSQNGRCTICNDRVDRSKIKIDHDHETLEIRGLLCSNCNVGIGMLKDDTAILSAAIRYLEG